MTILCNIDQPTSRGMRDGLAVSGTRNKANRGNREVTYHAYRAFRALFFDNSSGVAGGSAQPTNLLAPQLGHT
jgi:hypothetical protein